MRISDWSSDVCSSDLERCRRATGGGPRDRRSHSRCRIRSCDGCRAPGRDAASCRLCGPAMPPYCWSAAMTFSPEGPYGTIVTGPPVEQANAAIILLHGRGQRAQAMLELARQLDLPSVARSEEHTSELQSLMRISYAVFCLKKKKPYQYQATHVTISYTIV